MRIQNWVQCGHSHWPTSGVTSCPKASRHSCLAQCIFRTSSELANSVCKQKTCGLRAARWLIVDFGRSSMDVEACFLLSCIVYAVGLDASGRSTVFLCQVSDPNAARRAPSERSSRGVPSSMTSGSCTGYLSKEWFTRVKVRCLAAHLHGVYLRHVVWCA